jgi:hypothetical protein
MSVSPRNVASKIDQKTQIHDPFEEVWHIGRSKWATQDQKVHLVSLSPRS